MSKSQDQSDQPDTAHEAQAESKRTGAGKKSRSNKQDERLQALEEQVASLTQDLQRERADFSNYRRRSEADKQQAKDYAKAELLAELLPILDDLQRALTHTPGDLADHSWAQGVSKVHENLQQKLGALGLEKIQTLGQPFDPQLHEAVGYDGNEEGGEVITEELRSGYLLDGTVLRPAMVRVGSERSSDSQDSATNAKSTNKMNEEENNE